MSDDAVFLALANPVRRRLLVLLADGPRTAGDLASQFSLSRPAVAEHLQVLRRADLVSDEAVGRQRHYRLTAEPLEQLSEWLHPFERFWRDRLRTFAQVVEADAAEVNSAAANRAAAAISTEAANSAEDKDPS